MLYSNLLRDFRSTESNAFLAGYEHVLQSDIVKFRSLNEKELGYITDIDCSADSNKLSPELRKMLGREVGRFKRTKQMEALLKKYRFSTDAFTDEELSDRTLNKFMDEQLRLHRPMPLRTSGHKVLQRARLIARRILGEYPGDEVIENVQFGRKSSIGCPLSLAYLDIKLTKCEAFTGTSATTDFFMSQVLPGDKVLQRILKGHDFSSLKNQLNYQHLNLVEVPKTWKTYRLITPLTLLGLFFSYGIGRVVTARLKDAGLNIGKLQERHRSLVEEFSRTLRHATADLSAASDSITSELLNRILPRAWYVALRKTFVRSLIAGDKRFSSVSVLPMGNGATFPVETLVFYCIIKAVGDLTKTKGIYSVYGDDLIYPTRIHKTICGIFPQIHLKLNLDKTFVSFPFRESCGSDYYRGQDVRPYFLKGESQMLTRVRYEAFLYKVYNGLTARWDPLEIRGTLTWLLSELSIVTHEILRVPPSFPDYSGVKVSQCTELPFKLNFLSFAPITVQYNHGSCWFQFGFLTETPKKRVVKTVQPYYWLALQGLTDEVVDEYGRNQVFTSYSKPIKGKLMSAINKQLVTSKMRPKEAKSSSLRWKKVGVKKSTYYHKGRKIEKERTIYNAFVASRTGATVSKATTRTDPDKGRIISHWI
jgi:hypothetical protein